MTRMTAKRKQTTKTKRMTSRQEGDPVGLPYTDLINYAVVYISIANDLNPDGFDVGYGVVNKLTGILEGRGTSLPVAVLYMQSQQQMLDKIITGELNGFVGPDAKTVLSAG